ncbi:alanine--tRNA ligase [Apibacter adventoris]|uniref:Alanine--tRNA ligase n=1 Tax=Apibacter adventoris TaxID=1679466 RepID=A0A0H4Q2N0_9FLAO|nr:alanine--tRNA ligase [Apibacter adventoris]AKP61302.1 alanyl-tRNA synthetase [Apibacter adventoris]PQL93762.1 alanine--tRNA ligase [Apibacter adventoris]
MTSKQIRQKFLEFFQSKQHTIVPSAPIVLKDDPTLMFSNSGMTQFKNFFLGYKDPENKRVADTQKCLRVSGKHNDLDDVGKDTYHHTMFEMLGNWSFGDYFKKEAIAWAWELLTEVYKIPKEYLYVTIFEGDDKEGLIRDSEAFNYWKEHISEDRILLGNKKDNFWEMGDTGPCGPSSEIHVDIRSKEEKEKIDGKTLVNKDHPQVIEIWNLVFMEFLRKADGSLDKLPKQNVDTGMGFERLCMVLQGKMSNYDTDVFTPLIQKIESISGYIYGNNAEKDIAIRVIVDHVRAIAFSIADGQLPSNSGAGYVIRRILRRAIGYAFRFLEVKDPILYTLIPVLKEQMGEFFPEIEKQEHLIKEVIKEEETNFLKTIDQGLVRLSNFMKSHKDLKIIPGDVIFELYDTYGFPSDLSRIIAEEKGLTVDEQGFISEMKKQKQRSKFASTFKNYDWVVLEEDQQEEFVGYDFIKTQIKITQYRKVENKEGEFYQLVFQVTPFYAESGGQVGDTGFIENINEKIEILNTKKENNLIVHIVKELPKYPEFPFQAIVNSKRRQQITQNHSATHLLHEALREVLGNHVEQKGSYVGPDYLRFDFSHFNKMTKEEIALVEKKVNIKIYERLPLEENRSVPFKQAIEMGAMALFGEKYGDVVRVIKFGDSIELCGGTHVSNTQDILIFKIMNETSSSAGIRRIEAITGETGLNFLQDQFNEFEELKNILKTNENPIKAVEKLYSENEQLKKQLEQYIKEKAVQEKALWKNAIQKIGDINYLGLITNLNNSSVKDIIFQLKAEIKNLFIIVGTKTNNKPTISVGISDDLVKSGKCHAGTIVKELAQEIKGGGGGQPSFATAGGSDIGGLERAIQKSKIFL